MSWKRVERNRMKYIQCELIKGNSHQTCWIPEKYAVVGKYVKIKNNDEWEDGWKVLESYNQTKLEESVLNERNQDYKKTRKASDI
jgi:hypothetical protein